VFESAGNYFDMREGERERERERERGNRRMDELNNEELRNFFCLRNLRRTRWIERINTCGGWGGVYK